jgi:hypothetical protein
MPDPSNAPPLDWRSFETEQTGVSVGHCDCCGSTTKRVWGFIRREGAVVAAYFVGWTEQGPDHGATFDLVLGKWGDSTTAQDRYGVALDFRIVEASPQFMVVDAGNRATSDSELVGAALKRSDVIGTALAPQVFAIVDAIYLGDLRLDELRSWVVS